ncbi:inactive protein RESTRICTED TEV MOVEMENT 2-like [Populus alba x Populus x berolinensis]|uniref:Inactive protein RESTRICTED TEV MOVEMENT 2-like n=1 Tax=Populus alba x Populus x berolinensis TaxID=444605 RepID=A0AAD6M247_9ROSI|nr:inactive protein RESTRICTED TEV MOVEMENT 2-like [Populus alba x Populus x berolinensis]
MANIGGVRPGGIAERTRSRHHLVEEYVPSSAWTEDPNSHCLLVHLPDFRKEEVKLQVDDPGKLTVSGERLVNNSKCIYFEQTFKLPQNSDTDNITGKLDGEILYVTVPKQEETSEETSEEPDLNQPNTIGDQKNNNEILEEKESSSNSRDCYRLVPRKYWGQEDEATPLERASSMIMKNKGILLVVVLGFSLGVLVGFI